MSGMVIITDIDLSENIAAVVPYVDIVLQPWSYTDKCTIQELDLGWRH